MAQPTQPNLPQYPIADLELFPDQTTLDQPFDPAQPVKKWKDPSAAGLGSQTYNVFDPNAPATGYVSVTSILNPAGTNIPGAFTYPNYTVPATDAYQSLIGGGVAGTLLPASLSTLAQANTLAAEIAPLYPGVVLQIQVDSGGPDAYVFPADEPRRVYLIFNGTAEVGNVGQLLKDQNANGVGAPGHWAITQIKPVSGGSFPSLTWVQDQQLTAAPVGAATVPSPIRPLLSNEQIVHLPGSLFNQAGTWVVERTDMQQPQTPETNDQQFADVKAALAALQTGLSAVRAKLGA